MTQQPMDVKGGKKRTRKPKTRPAAQTSDPGTPLKEEPPKRKRGRPSKYDPAMCDVVIDLGEQGKSRTQIARTLGTTRKTLLEWEEVHPDFRNAMSIASDYAQAWWEDQGQIGLTDKSFNGHVYSFQMKNRFREDYSEKVNVEHNGTVAFNNIWQMIGQGKTEGIGREKG